MEKEINALPNIPNLEVFKTKIDAADIENQEIINDLNNTVTSLLNRKSKVLSIDSLV